MKNIYVKIGALFGLALLSSVLIFALMPNKKLTTAVFQVYVPSTFLLGSMRDFENIDSSNRMQYKDIEAVVKLYFAENRQSGIRHLMFLPSSTNLMFQFGIYSPSHELNQVAVDGVQDYLKKIFAHKNADLILLLDSYQKLLQSRISDSTANSKKFNSLSAQSGEAYVEFEKLTSRLAFDNVTIQNIVTNLNDNSIVLLQQYDTQKPISPNFGFILSLCLLVATVLGLLLMRKNEES